MGKIDKKRRRKTKCRHCNSLNGSTSSEKQKYKCKSCHRQFVLNPKSNKIKDGCNIINKKYEENNVLNIKNISTIFNSRSG
jgi:transposase-like protein